MDEMVGSVADGLCAMFPELIRPMLEQHVRTRLGNMLQTGIHESEAVGIVMEACIDDALRDPNLLMGVAEELLERENGDDRAAGRHSRSNSSSGDVIYQDVVVDETSSDDDDDDIRPTSFRPVSVNNDSLDLNSTPGSSRASSPLIPPRSLRSVSPSSGAPSNRSSPVVDSNDSSLSNTPVEGIHSEHSPESKDANDEATLDDEENRFPMDPSTSKTSLDVRKDGHRKSKSSAAKILVADETSTDDWLDDHGDQGGNESEKRDKKRPKKVLRTVRHFEDLTSPAGPSLNKREDRKRTYDVLFDDLSDSEQDLQRALEESIMMERNENLTGSGNERMDVGDYRDTINELDDDSPEQRNNILDFADFEQACDRNQLVKAAKLSGPATAAATPSRIASTSVLSPARFPGPGISKSAPTASSSSILSPSRLKLPSSAERDVKTSSVLSPAKLNVDLPGTSQWPDQFATAVHYAEKAAFYADKFRQSLPGSPESKTAKCRFVKCRHLRPRLLYLSDQSLKDTYGLSYYIKDSFMNILDWETPHVKRSVIEKIKRMYPYGAGARGPACDWVEMIQALTHSKDTHTGRYSCCQHFEKIMNSKAVGEVPEVYLGKVVSTPMTAPRSRPVPKFDDDLPTFTCPKKRFRSGDEGHFRDAFMPILSPQRMKQDDGQAGVSRIGNHGDGVERPPRPGRPKVLRYSLDDDDDDDDDDEWMPEESVTVNKAEPTATRSVGKTKKVVELDAWIVRTIAPRPGVVEPVEPAEAPPLASKHRLPVRVADKPLPVKPLLPAAARPPAAAQPPCPLAAGPLPPAQPLRPLAAGPLQPAQPPRPLVAGPLQPAQPPRPLVAGPLPAAQPPLPLAAGPLPPAQPPRLLAAGPLPPAQPPRPLAAGPLPPAQPQRPAAAEPQPGPAPVDQVPNVRREEVVIGDGPDIPMATTISTDDKVKNVLELFPDADGDYIREKLTSKGGSVQMVIEDFLDPDTAAYKKRRASIIVQHDTAEEESAEEELDENFESDNSLVRPYDLEYKRLAEYHLTKEFRRVSLKDIRLIRKYVPRYLAARQTLVDALSKAKLLEFAKRTRLGGDPMSVNYSLPIAYTDNGLRRTYPATGNLLQSGRQGTSPPGGVSALIQKELNYLERKQKRVGEKQDEVMAQKMNEDEYTDENQLIECACCYDEVVFESMVQCYEGHLFCKNCLDRYAQEAVYGQGKCSLVCMEGGCGAQFMRQMLKGALSAKMFKLYETRVQDEMVNLADLPNLVTCPKCNYKLIMDDDNNRVFECQNPSCLVKTCRDCKVGWEEHVGKKCKELEQKDETSLRTKFEEEMTKAMLRQCSQCKAQFLKSEGCNKMTCRCGHKMCYICRKPGIDYNHFCRHPRDPGKGCTSCKACSLWSSPQEDDDRAIEELQKKASEERKERGFDDGRVIGAPPEKRPKNQAAQPARPQAPHAVVPLMQVVVPGAQANPLLNQAFNPQFLPNIPPWAVRHPAGRPPHNMM